MACSGNCLYYVSYMLLRLAYRKDRQKKVETASTPRNNEKLTRSKVCTVMMAWILMTIIIILSDGIVYGKVSNREFFFFFN